MSVDFSQYSVEEQQSVAITAQGGMVVTMAAAVYILFPSPITAVAVGITLLWAMFGAAMFAYYRYLR